MRENEREEHKGEGKRWGRGGVGGGDEFLSVISSQKVFAAWI